MSNIRKQKKDNEYNNNRSMADLSTTQASQVTNQSAGSSVWSTRTKQMVVMVVLSIGLGLGLLWYSESQERNQTRRHEMIELREDLEAWCNWVEAKFKEVDANRVLPISSVRNSLSRSGSGDETVSLSEPVGGSDQIVVGDGLVHKGRSVSTYVIPRLLIGPDDGSLVLDEDGVIGATRMVLRRKLEVSVIDVTDSLTVRNEVRAGTAVLSSFLGVPTASITELLQVRGRLDCSAADLSGSLVTENQAGFMRAVDYQRLQQLPFTCGEQIIMHGLVRLISVDDECVQESCHTNTLNNQDDNMGQKDSDDHNNGSNGHSGLDNLTNVVDVRATLSNIGVLEIRLQVPCTSTISKKVAIAKVVDVKYHPKHQIVLNDDVRGPVFDTNGEIRWTPMCAVNDPIVFRLSLFSIPERLSSGQWLQIQTQCPQMRPKYRWSMDGPGHMETDNNRCLFTFNNNSSHDIALVRCTILFEGLQLTHQWYVMRS